MFPFPLLSYVVQIKLTTLQGGSALGLQLILLLPVLRKPSYEIFLRMHQGLAAVALFGIWRHITSQYVFPRLYVYVPLVLFLTTFLLQGVVVLYRNGVFRGRLPRAEISTEDSSTVAIKISLSRPLKVAAGQYINVWIPSVSFWSILQSHPFVVTNWAERKQDSIDLLVTSRCGFTQKLQHYAGTTGGDRLVLFSGPHGISIPVDRSQTIVMVADGFGMASFLPYLRKLIYSYNAWKSPTRRIHVIWQLEKRGKRPTSADSDFNANAAKRMAKQSRNS
jgi:predicted ferric reductase